jgi:hypothetical protein
VSSWYQELVHSIQANQSSIFIWMTLLQMAAIIVLGYYVFSIKRLRNTYNQLAVGVEGKNLESVLLQLLDKVKLTEDGLNQVMKAVEEYKKNGEFHLQRWSLLRYKAFSNTGGDQSFSLALLDSKGNGVVLSSIYGREESRVYAKSIQEGRSTYPMSAEEEETLRQALGDEKQINKDG